eukprot:scaffold2860_cov106-Isochrysis_galbana.AAC.4
MRQPRAAALHGDALYGALRTAPTTWRYRYPARRLHIHIHIHTAAATTYSNDALHTLASLRHKLATPVPATPGPPRPNERPTKDQRLVSARARLCSRQIRTSKRRRPQPDGILD